MISKLFNKLDKHDNHVKININYVENKFIDKSNLPFVYEDDTEQVDLIEVQNYKKYYVGPNRFYLRVVLLDKLIKNKISEDEWLQQMNNIYCELQTIKL